MSFEVAIIRNFGTTDAQTMKALSWTFLKLFKAHYRKLENRYS